MQQEAVDRRERLRRLALETIDLAKDPYFMRNHLGQYECRLCLTLHNNEGNYLAHTQARSEDRPLDRVLVMIRLRSNHACGICALGAVGHCAPQQLDVDCRPFPFPFLPGPKASTKPRKARCEGSG